MSCCVARVSATYSTRSPAGDSSAISAGETTTVASYSSPLASRLPSATTRSPSSASHSRAWARRFIATTTPTVPSTCSSSRAASSRTVAARSPSRTGSKRGTTPVERTAAGDSMPGMASASTLAASSAISAGLR